MWGTQTDDGKQGDVWKRFNSLVDVGNMPKDMKLALVFAIMKPIKTHVHSF